MNIRVVLALVAVVGSFVGAAAQTPVPMDPSLGVDGKPLPGTSIPCASIAEKRQELGCYVIGRPRLVLPAGPVSVAP